jgi:hypothetical protein
VDPAAALIPPRLQGSLLIGLPDVVIYHPADNAGVSE